MSPLCKSGMMPWSVCILPMAATNETTQNKEPTPAYSPPTPQIETENDGMVRVTVGDQIGWVSSYHLVDPKVRQLRHAWLKKHNSRPFGPRMNEQE